MINNLYRIILTMNSTSWMIVIYGIKAEWDFVLGNRVLTSIILLGIPIFLTFLAGLLLRWFSFSTEQIKTCKSIELADNEFLPVYLGYFFVALGISNLYSLFFVYGIVFVFSFLSQAQYFNPLFLLLGFHYYHVETMEGTRIFVIWSGDVIRSPKDINLPEIKRLNDTTYIFTGGKTHV